MVISSSRTATGRGAARQGVATALVLWVAVGCSDHNVPSSLFLTIESAASEVVPDEVRITTYGDQGVLVRDQRLPVSPGPVAEGPRRLGAVRIYIPVATRHVRLDVRGMLASIARLHAIEESDISPNRQQAITVSLVGDVLGDSDHDAVPDAIDNCPQIANANQEDSNGNRTGDACERGSDGAADGSTDARFDAVGNGDAAAEGRADATLETGSDGGSDAAADAKLEAGVEAGVEAGTDSIADAGMTMSDVGPGDTGTGGASGLLTITQPADRGTVDLTAEGVLDWAHWGADTVQTFDHKANGGGRIGNLAQAADSRFTNNDITCVWSDGMPSATGNTESGVYSTGLDAVLSFSVVADGTTRKLRLYVGANNVDARLTAHLSDGSAADAVFNVSGRGQYEVPIEIAFRAGAPNRALLLTWTPTSSAALGAISIKAATLF